MRTIQLGEQLTFISILGHLCKDCCKILGVALEFLV